MDITASHPLRISALRTALVALLAAAALVVTGLVPAEAASRRTGSAPVPVVVVHGSDDTGTSSVTGRRGP